MVLSERQRVNLASLLVTLGVLFLAVQMSNGSFATRINNISANLDRALSAAMDDKNTNFTDLTDSATYLSNTYFNSKGMAGLYNLTSDFMDLIFSKNIYPEGFVTIQNNQLQLADYQSEWQSLLTKYGGLLAMIIILALLLVFMPFCGVCFCCCRCCGKCGARSQPFDKKHDLCKKILLATVLIGLGTMLLFGVVCAFVSNQQMQEGVDELPENLRNTVKDLKTYLNVTKGQVNTLLNTNYKEFEGVLLATINESSDIVYDQLAQYSNATKMTEVANIVNALPNIQSGLQTLKYSTNSLRVYASQLNDAVRKVKRDMLALLSSEACLQIPKCKEISDDISKLQTNIHFNNLPELTDQIADLDQLSNNNTLTDAVNKGNEKLQEIKIKIGEAVNGTLKTARDQILRAGDSIQNGANNVTQVIDDLQRQIDSNTKPVLNDAEKYIKEYSPYRYYAALVISCLLLLITLCVTLGLICGICGKRPEGYGDDCCNKGTGSSFLICGVYFMFLGGFIIAVVVLVTFIVGVVSQRVVCDPIRDPKNSQLFELVDKVNLSSIYIDFPLSTALDKCYQNESIYEVFNLENKFSLNDIKNYVAEYNISNILDQMNLGNLDDKLNNFEILDNTEMELLESFADSKFGQINFDEFKDLLATNFTTANLTVLSNEVNGLIEDIKAKNLPNTETLIRQLEVNKMNIIMYQEKIVEPMIKNATDVIGLAETLEVDIKLNHTSFNVAMLELVKEIKEAEERIKLNGSAFLTETVKTFADGIVYQVQTYIDRVVNKTKNEVGKCGPVSLVIKATLTSTCDKILLPWNGYWFGLFWSLLLFVPTIIVSVKLATLYQKHSAYSRDLIEAEYLYDAYVDRDNIPLNSRNSKTKKNKKHKRYEDRPLPASNGDMRYRGAAGSNYGGERGDARYADMAPKQWEDLPADGPPQYQRAPTEYERPPPYYYPGAGDSNQ